MLISEFILVRNLLAQANSGLEIWYVKFQTIQTAAGVILAATLGVRMVDASILVVTYNHGPYISQCFESILAQKTKRRIEIVWYDDASTDNTVEIGEAILKNSPFEIIRIHHANNRYQRRIPSTLESIERCRGKYFFWAEGDDCWLDENKIDLQVDALEEYKNINLCFTPAYVLSGSNPSPIGVLARHSEKKKIFNLEDVISGDGGFMPTISLCLRREIFNTAPDWLYENLPVLDYPMQVIASAPAGALYLPNITCGYRQHVEGSWTTRIFNNDKKRMGFESDFLKLLVQLNADFPGNRNSFAKIIFSHATALLRLSIEQANFDEMQKAMFYLRKFM